MFIEPVFGKKFFGREEVIGILQKRITDLKGGYRQNLALAGPMLSGKSSILRHFLKHIKDPDIIPIYIEMNDEDFSVFAEQYMASLLYQYLKSEGEKPIHDFKTLKESARRRIPGTVSKIDEISKLLNGKKEDAAYERLLDLTSNFKEETGKSCIVILDEFQNLSNFRIKKPFQVFGKFIMVQKNTMYIVSSSQKTLLKDILSKKLDLLFGNFEIIDVNGFDSQTARSFISDRLKGVTGCETMMNYLIYMSQGSPFYLEVLVSRFSELLANQEKLSAKECLLASFADCLYRSKGLLNQYFTNNINFFLEKKARKKYLPILVSLAGGKSTVKEIQADMSMRDPSLTDSLKRLQEMDIVYSSGVFYKISERLFEYWLRYVYSLKKRSIVDDMDIKYLEFKNSIEKDYSAFCEFSSRNLEEVISELFRSFKNDKVQVGAHCRKLMQFDTVELAPLSNNILKFTGKKENKYWVCHVKQHDISDEHDICNLWNTKFDDKSIKITKKIFISLKGIEQNAFLLAKEHDIWVWDINELNKILRLFGKFELVI